MSTRIAVVGDVLLDVDLEGRVERLCPDAPAPVLDDPVEHPRPGGAGLAAALIAADGFDVTLITALGNDAAAVKICGLLEERGVHVLNLGASGETSEKVRVRAGGQSVVRIDRGGPLGDIGAWTEHAGTVLDHADGVLVSDYGRGLTSRPDVRLALEKCASLRPVVWDPHPRGAEPVPGTVMVTPSRSEAFHLAGLSPKMSLASVSACAHELARRWRAHGVCVTLGADGALYRGAGAGTPYVVPAVAFEVTDACGAGDRFAGAAIVALARGAGAREATSEAVTAASVFVASGGAAGWSKPPVPTSPPAESQQAHEVIRRVRAKGGTVVATGGCFDLIHAGHVRALTAARSLGDCLIVCVNSDDSVRRLKGPSRPVVGISDRVAVLEAFSMVDAVAVFDEDTPVALLEDIRPDVWAKGGDYETRELPEASTVAKWGGTCVVLPYSEGRSTTNLMKEVISRGSSE